MRTAQALRDLPEISAAFADGRLSYTKVRALTRVAAQHDADALLQYALRLTAAQVEERCRQLRNADPQSVNVALRAWEHRSLKLWRDAARNVMSIRVEVPLEDGELVTQALERAIGRGEAASGIEFAEDAIAEHEGGFTVRRDSQGELSFRRRDGRSIPRFGYRLDDVRDEYEVERNPSAEGCCVRESRGLYLVR